MVNFRALIFLVLAICLTAGRVGAQPITITSAYTLASGACGNTVIAQGGAFYALATSGSYAAGCRVTIFNNDPIPMGVNSTGAKFVNFVSCTTGVTGTYVYPQAGMEIEYSGAAWLPTRCPGPWMMPGGIFTLEVNPSNGSDSWGAADGLGTGSRAFASINNTLYQMAGLMAANFAGATRVFVALCAGCTDNSLIHWPPHGAPTNSAGRAAVTISCRNGTIAQQLQMFFAGAILEVEKCTFTGGISLNEGAELIIMGNENQFKPVSNGYVFVVGMGSKIFDGTQGGQTNVLGGTGKGFVLASGSSFVQLPANLQQVGNQTWTDSTIRIQSNSFVSIPSWGGNGYSTTGTKLNILECSVIEGIANVQGTGINASACGEVR